MDWAALRVSLWLGIGTVVVLLPAGIWLARALAVHRFRGKALVEALVTVPLVLPPTVVVEVLKVCSIEGSRFFHGLHSCHFLRSPISAYT